MIVVHYHLIDLDALKREIGSTTVLGVTRHLTVPWVPREGEMFSFLDPSNADIRGEVTGMVDMVHTMQRYESTAPGAVDVSIHVYIRPGAREKTP